MADNIVDRLLRMGCMNTKSKIIRWVFYDKIPVTKLVIISNALSLIFFSLCHPGRMLVVKRLMYTSPGVMESPWTVFTYPLIYTGCISICFCFTLFWMWIAGGSLERSWGSKRFVLFFFMMSAISALGLFLGGLITNETTLLTGLYLPLAGVTMAFAMLDPERAMLYGFVIPMKLKYLAVLDMLIVLVGFGRQDPILGVSALLGCAFSYWYVTYISKRWKASDCEIIRIHKKSSTIPSLSPLGWYKEYRERKRLKDFFDKSGFKD